RVNPILFNRRHLGVLTFLVSLAHALLAFGYYHAFGVVSPLRSFLSSNTNFGSVAAFPFELLGAAALLILFLLAATSHDFWLKNLSARSWKRLHFGVYVAYALVIAHVALGAMQDRAGPVSPMLMLIGAVVLAALHIAAGLRERSRDQRLNSPELSSDGWVDAGLASAIPHDRARVIDTPGGERLAIFRHGNGVSCVTNVCAHQGGPLGEGRVVDGCITCPWHGWQYRPEDGCAPAPFTEKIATHQVRIVAGRVLVNPAPLPPGTPVAPASITKGSHHG
ncbi:MAG: ferric reductase-like transmembrane domain-containing protein, partial [Phycisphaerales bacterium]|nr:ferric reductase-like transmembrane domain-containing protein [Phycisphaerales bacterium]